MSTAGVTPGVTRLAGAAYRIHRVLLLLLALAGAAGAVSAQSWLYAAGGSRYAVVDPSSGAIVHEGILSADGFTPADDARVEIVPTPGGRFVFFFVGGADAAIVVDAETHLPVRTITLPAGVDSLQFSSMGDAVYLRSGEELVSIGHRRGTIEGSAQDAPSLAAGLVAFNRRATRIYGQRGDRLVYALARNGDQVADVRVGRTLHDWQVSPNFRYLLGSRQDGSGLTLVDEQRARVIGEIREDVVPGSAGFDSGSRSFHALTGDGREIIVADVRRARVQDRIPLQRPAADLFLNADGDFFVLHQDGTIGLRAGAQLQTVSIGTIGEVRDLAMVELKPGQGFACF